MNIPAASQPVIRVLLVDDSSVARGLLRAILEAEEDIRVVGEAADGQQGLELASRLRPDLICMDLDMPVMDGLQCIDAIMHQKAIPILVVSARADARKAYQALDLGALDVMAKPGLDERAAELVSKVRLLAGVSMITRIRRHTPDTRTADAASPTDTGRQRNFRNIVAIACSTGGPQALAWLLPRLPVEFPAPVLISQHISDGFVEGMVTWLGTLSSLPVKVAEDGECLRARQVYVSPSESHMTVTEQDRIRLVPRKEDDLYHPCCNLLLESVAHAYRSDGIGLIMTGMGRDGALGMQAIHECGGITLAQDEASSVIFGMNQEAIRLGAIQHIVTLKDIPQQLIRLVLP